MCALDPELVWLAHEHAPIFASIQNSEVVFDYMEAPQVFSGEMRDLVTKRTEQLEKLDERWASRFEPAGIAAVLRAYGFCDIEDINFDGIRSRFGHAVQGLAAGQVGVHVVHAKHRPTTL